MTYVINVLNCSLIKCQNKILIPPWYLVSFIKDRYQTSNMRLLEGNIMGGIHGIEL